MDPFQPITLENIEQLRPYIQNQSFRSCDYTIGAIFQWRAYLHTTYALVDGMLVMRAEYPGEGDYYCYPVGGGNMDAALHTIEEDARENGRALIFCAVPAEGVEVLRARYGTHCVAEEHRDWADYVYNLRDLIDFPGKKYHTQRNHLNHFLKEYPDARLVPVTEETMPAAKRFLAEYEKHVPLDKVIEAEEMLRSRELLADALRLGLSAAYLETGEEIIALSIGEVVGDTLYVHVEKARVDYMGAYQAIVSLFAAYAAQPDTAYINREDDSGEEGLRYSKLAYRPVMMTDKYWVTVDRVQ